MKYKIIALLQARTDSKRLPKKVLKKILGKPMILHQLERASRSLLIDKMILLTSKEESDNELANIVTQNNFFIYRGSKDNVLKRFYNSLLPMNLNDNDIIVRLTGDCPLHDAKIIDELIEGFINNNCDYMANCLNPIYPDGMDVEVFNYKSLKMAYENAVLKSDLEHVTPYIRNNKNLNTCNLIKKPIHSDWRLTVDEGSDFELIENIFNHFNTTFFSFIDIVEFLEKNPHFLNINNNITRNEGYAKSLLEDVNESRK
jgi:spore coat polysaccharide biosynthesis protein SpsF (cytidylyltransferase family)